MQDLKTYPIVLAHGIARFDELTDRLFVIDNDPADDGLHYFRNIRTHLEANGFIVRHSHVEWAAGVDVRSNTLRKNVDSILQELQAPKVHIIAHSMGGLDARHMLYDGRNNGFYKKVASLTTLATPHHGSPAADAFLPFAPKDGRILGINIDGLKDLTTSACRAFNAQASSWEKSCGVQFQAYACAQKFPHIFAPLKVTWPIIHAAEGDNDGLVSVQSARWNEEYFVPPVIDADHLNILGWSDGAEFWRGENLSQLEARIRRFYLSIAAGLAKRFPCSSP